MPPVLLELPPELLEEDELLDEELEEELELLLVVPKLDDPPFDELLLDEEELLDEELDDPPLDPEEP
ncbi:hypothetical protein [Sphingobium cloacae]|uniref:hypothetical protein n=1 Tax=Sphingobium cloacae TaxID=120107 RepID=UPI0008326566|nr:hypothetical protein [Sphingobium cloacae]